MTELDRQSPQEPRALVAIDRSMQAFARAFPYLRWRHDQAGLHALRNDNAQLVAIVGTQPHEFGPQLDWFTLQMSERGMPSWMVEVDLELLARVLRRALPDHPDMGTRIAHAAHDLGTRRHAAMVEGKFRRAGSSFAARLEFGPSRLWSGFGKILASAVIDERLGVSHAVLRVSEWATNRQRFGPRWTEAVEASIAEFRRL